MFTTQHAISGKWIVDFFFPHIRLAIEIDGPSHLDPEQRALDDLKAADCERLDITLLRLTNREVWGPRDVLVQKMKALWHQAKYRENKIIGKPYKPE